MSWWEAFREEQRAYWERRAAAYGKSLADLAARHVLAYEAMIEKGKTEDLASEKSHSSEGEPA